MLTIEATSLSTGPSSGSYGPGFVVPSGSRSRHAEVAYDAHQRLTRLFGTRVTVVAYPEDASRLIWQEQTFTVLPLNDR